MVPSGLRGLAATTSFTAIYIPFWTFDARVDADWRAEVEHTESSGSGGNRRKRTVWRWESGQVRHIFDDLLTGGSKRVSLLLLGQISNYDSSQLVQYDPKYLAGILAQSYDIQLEDAWEMARTLMREVVRAECRKCPSSDRVRNFSLQLDYADETWRFILVPLYIATYQDGCKTYQELVNGQTAAVAGQRPVDWRKVALVLTMLVLPGLIVSIWTWTWLIGSEVPNTPPSGLLFAIALLALFGLAICVSFAIRILKNALRLDDA